VAKELWFQGPNEGKAMVDPLKGRELLRLSVRWPLTIRTESGDAHGETRNITGEGMFLYCSERLHEGIVYPMTIKLSEKRVEMRGNVTWSNLNSCTSLNLNSAMGFYFMRIDEDEGRQSLRAAIVAECRKHLRMRQGADQLTDSPPSSKTQVIASLGDPLEY
jgi:PilZ domain